MSVRECVPSPVSLVLRAEVSHADRRVRAGELRRVTRGVYAEASEWDALAPWERYRARVHAVARVDPDTVFVLESAAALRGMPVFGEPSHVHVVVPSPAKARVTAGVRIHSAERMPRLERIGGILVAAADEVAVGLAAARHPAVGLATANAALRADSALSASALLDLAHARPSARGIRWAEWVMSRATAVTESPLEDVSLAVLEWLGFEAPELQRWFRGGDRADRVDFWWPGARVAGEADGELKYSGDARPALRARNARDARLRECGVRAAVHWGWPDVVAYAQLRAILSAAGLEPTRPEVIAPLRSLRVALSPRPS